jgi:hypothetical protein
MAGKKILTVWTLEGASNKNLAPGLNLRNKFSIFLETRLQKYTLAPSSLLATTDIYIITYHVYVYNFAIWLKLVSVMKCM